MSVKMIGLAPNKARCDCEAGYCHPTAQCSSTADFRVEICGIKTNLCFKCVTQARHNDAKQYEGEAKIEVPKP